MYAPEKFYRNYLAKNTEVVTKYQYSDPVETLVGLLIVKKNSAKLQSQKNFWVLGTQEPGTLAPLLQPSRITFNQG